MNEPIAGIDLGTTNSLIGVVEAGFPILLADEQGSRLTPSAVYFPKDGTAPVIGSAALRRRATDPGRTIVSVKALMGRRRGDVDIHPAFPIAWIHMVVSLSGSPLSAPSSLIRVPTFSPSPWPAIAIAPCMTNPPATPGDGSFAVFSQPR